jgi:hypothetical protein
MSIENSVVSLERIHQFLILQRVNQAARRSTQCFNTSGFDRRRLGAR